MELVMFNPDFGYLEGIVRGYRTSFLTQMDYKKMKCAENLEDLRTILESTDYASVFVDEPHQLNATIIAKKCRLKLAQDYLYLRQQSDGKLAQFLDFIAREKMIDNLITLLQGAVNKSDPNELLDRIDPIGWFSGINTIISSDCASGFDDLYRIILVDTQIGPYFERFLHSFCAIGTGPSSSPATFSNNTTNIIDSGSITIMNSALKKMWLEDFYNFSISLGGTSAEVMSHLLKTEADFRDLSLTLNCINLQGQHIIQDRNKLYTSIGYLYPAGTDRLCKAFNEATVQFALAPFQRYARLYESCRSTFTRMDTKSMRFDSNERSLEDLFYAELVKLCELSFERQLHFGIFYVWVKLKQQEIRNIAWIADMILLRRPQDIARVLPIFQPRVDV